MTVCNWPILAVWAIWPGVDVATATRSVRLFAEEVIPALRDL